MAAFVTLLFAAGAYLLGSIPTGLLLAARHGVDLRAVGSGNIGATNAARALGRGAGLATFAVDAGKGLAPTLLARGLGLPPAAVALVGLTAFLGHVFPVYLRFRGGKGVATAAGIFLAMAPLPTGIALAAWALVFGVWRIVSVASLVAALVLPAALFFFRASWPISACAGAVLVVVVFRHRGNLTRLLERREPKG